VNEYNTVLLFTCDRIFYQISSNPVDDSVTIMYELNFNAKSYTKTDSEQKRLGYFIFMLLLLVIYFYIFVLC